MTFGNYLAVLLIAIFATAVNSQTIGTNATIGAGTSNGTTNGTASALISFDIIGNSTLDPVIRNAIEALRNATINGTEAVRKAIAEAARDFVNNGNVTVNAIINFLQAAQKNITATGNATLTEIITRIREYAETNRQQIQVAIERLVAQFQTGIQEFLAALNRTGAFFAGLIPPIRPFPTFPPFTLSPINGTRPPITGGINIGFGGFFGRR